MELNVLKQINLYKIFSVVVILLGIILRITAFLHGRPFWLDESSLALNIVDNNDYFSPLLYVQAAPPFFMYLSKFIYNIVPLDAEFSLRIIPFLASVTALFLFYLFINKIFKNNIAKIVSLSLFAFNFKLIYYSSEFKQYSLETLIFLIIIFVFLKVKDMKSIQKVIYGLLLGIAIWFSNASVVAILSIGITYIIDKIRFKDFKPIDIFIFLPSVISLAIYYVVLYPTIHNEKLHTFWQNFFIKNDFSNISYIITDNSDFFFHSHIELFSTLVFLGIFIFLLKKQYIVVIPIIMTYLMSYLHICPSHGRIILFILPFLIISASSFADFKSKYIKYPAILFAIIYLILPQWNYSKRQFLYNRLLYEDISSPLKLAAEYIQQGDYLLTDSGNISSFNYYTKFHNFDKSRIIIISQEEPDFTQSFKNLPKGRYFYVFSHSRDRKWKLKSINEISKQLDNCKIEKFQYDNLLMTFTIF